MGRVSDGLKEPRVVRGPLEGEAPCGLSWGSGRGRGQSAHLLFLPPHPPRTCCCRQVRPSRHPSRGSDVLKGPLPALCCYPRRSVPPAWLWGPALSGPGDQSVKCVSGHGGFVLVSLLPSVPRETPLGLCVNEEKIDCKSTKFLKILT